MKDERFKWTVVEIPFKVLANIFKRRYCYNVQVNNVPFQNVFPVTAEHFEYQVSLPRYYYYIRCYTH